MPLYFTSNTNAQTPGQQNLSTTSKTIVQVSAVTATLRRAFIYEFEVGTDGAPNATDCAVVWDMYRQTTTGTGTVGVINAIDSVDAASGSVSTINCSSEPTTATNTQVWTLAANQRASYRWVVNPGGPGELVVPGTNVNGNGIRAKSATYASTAVAAIYFRE